MAGGSASKIYLSLFQKPYGLITIVFLDDDASSKYLFTNDGYLIAT